MARLRVSQALNAVTEEMGKVQVRQLCMQAKTLSPCVVAFDNDASTRIVNTLLTKLDGALDRRGIYVIGGTN